MQKLDGLLQNQLKTKTYIVAVGKGWTFIGNRLPAYATIVSVGKTACVMADS